MVRIIYAVLLILLSSTAHSAIFFEDSYETGDTSHTDSTSGATTAPRNVSSPDTVGVVSTLPRTGTYSLEISYEGNPDYADTGNAELGFTLGTSDYTDVYIRFYLYVPSNFVIRDSTGVDNNKFIRIWGDDYSDDVKVGASFGLSQYPYYETGGTAWPDHLPKCGGSNDILLPYADWRFDTGLSDMKGGWTAIELRYKVDTGSGDGVYQVWIDGVLEVDQTNVSWIDAPCSPGFFNHGYLFGSSSTGYTNTTKFYIDDVVFSTTYIGLTGTGEAGPLRSAGQPSSTLPTGTTNTTMSLTTDANATCKYGTSSDTYTNLPNTFTGAGTTSHTQSLTGLTNGSSTAYYIRCERTSDSEQNDTDYIITVAVAAAQQTLTTSKDGTGDGTLASVPGGIACGSTCTYDFDDNSNVVVTAIADISSEFTSWSGCTSVDGDECTINMGTSAQSVTATFTSTTVSCSNTNYFACLIQSTCEAESLYWWDGACRTIPEPVDTTGGNLITNGDFAAWTSGMPDTWSTYSNPVGIEENTYGCSLTTLNAVDSMQVYKTIPDENTYRYSFNIISLTESFEMWTAAEGSVYWTTTGTHTGFLSYTGAGDTHFYIQTPVGAVGTTIIGNFVLKEYVSENVSTGSMPLIQ